ncbi:MAG: hypothetical protein CMO20_03630 [Thermoplasmata archaeon]|nr:hypothetical protein [Thermoplasmata archaeon]|tara:strand:- start:724 stop:942 length:219 start_codon:yes stop_codon:yes gene_type:complete
MADNKSGERIPRRAAPQFDEVEGGLREAISRDGLIGTGLLDRNQFGPQAMILLLVITALGTGLLLGAIMMIT